MRAYSGSGCCTADRVRRSNKSSVRAYPAAGNPADDVLHAEARDGKIILSRGFQRRSLQERAAQYGGQLNLSAEMEREEPVGSEVW